MVHGVAKIARHDLATKQWLSSIPIHTHQVFIIHSSVNRHIGCLYVLNIANSADINIGVHVCFQTRVFSGYMLRRLVDHMVTIFLQEPLYCFPLWLHQFKIPPTGGVGGFFLLPTLYSMCYLQTIFLLLYFIFLF